MRFRFTGKTEFNTQDARVPGFRDFAGKSTGMGMNMTVAAGKSRAFVECVGFKNDTIKTMDKDGNKVDVEWDRRMDKEILDSVATYRKFVVKLDGERHEFITGYDFVKFIKDNLNKIKGKRFIVTGQIQKNEYQGRLKDRFQMQGLYEVEDEEEKDRLRVFGEFFLNLDGVDTADWKTEKRIYFNGYTREWLDKEHPKAYCDRQVVFDCSKANFDNAAHVKLVKFKLKQMGVDFDGENVKPVLKKSSCYAQNVTLTYVNGAEEIDFDESQLTDAQREMVELGMKSVNDFRPSGSIYGERKVEFKLVDFDLRGDYKDGLVKMEESKEDFEELIYKPVEEEKQPSDESESKNEDKGSSGGVDEEDIFD